MFRHKREQLQALVAPRRALVATIALLLAIIAAPLLVAAAPPAPSGGTAGTNANGVNSRQAPNAPYPLSGDAVNPAGSDQTQFTSSYASNVCVWCFFANSTATSTVALQGSLANFGAGTIGVRGWAGGAGVQGFQEDSCCSSAPLPTVKAGVYGLSSNNNGVYGESNSGIGVYGVSTDGYGVDGESDSGIGVYAHSNNSDGIDASNDDNIHSAVYAHSIGGNGVYASSDNGLGVYAHSGLTFGVYALSNAPVAGVLGETFGGDGSSIAGGVEGYNDQIGGGSVIKNAGVYGHCASCMGVVGTSNSYIGVKGIVTGTASASYGGYFSNTNGIGLYASTTNNTAIYALDVDTNTAAIYGNSPSYFGVYGLSGSSYGVVGISSSGFGVRGVSSSNYGFYAGSTSGVGGYSYTSSGLTAFRAHNNTTTAGHYGIISDGSLMVNGNITCTGSCLAAMGVPTNQGERLMYADASTQSKLSDEGTATLKDGRAVIKIDPLFAQTVSLDGGYQVFAMPGSFSSAGLTVGNKTASSFEVRELNGGKGNYSFDWRITALRKGYESTRMALAPQVPAAATVQDGLDGK